MWELDHKEGWAPKNWCFWTVVLEKTLESSLDNREIQPVNPKGNQSWIFIGRTYAETPILWPLNVKNWLTGKNPDAGKDWRQEEKGKTEDEMVGWHHQLDGHEFSKLWGLVMDKEALHGVVLGVTMSWTQLSNWTELTERVRKTWVLTEWRCINSEVSQTHVYWNLCQCIIKQEDSRESLSREIKPQR